MQISDYYLLATLTIFILLVIFCPQIEEWYNRRKVKREVIKAVKMLKNAKWCCRCNMFFPGEDVIQFLLKSSNEQQYYSCLPCALAGKPIHLHYDDSVTINIPDTVDELIKDWEDDDGY